MEDLTQKPLSSPPPGIAEWIPKRRSLFSREGLPPLPQRLFLIMVIALLFCVVAFGLLYWVSVQRGFINSRVTQIGPYPVHLVVNDEKAKVRVEETLAKMEEIYQLLDRNDEKSDIAKINRMAGITGVEVSPLTSRLVAQSLRFSHLFKGAYYPALGSLLDLWRARLRSPTDPLPSRKELKDALLSIKLSKLHVYPNLRVVALEEAGMKLDLQSILPAVMVSEAEQLLVKKGVKSAWIQVGDVSYALGEKKDGAPWEYTLPNAEDSKGSLGKLSLLSGESVVTFSRYQEGYEREGKKYHLLLDPRKAFPANLSRSFTVISRDPVAAAFLAQGAFVVGPRKGLKLVEKVKGNRGIGVAANGKVIASQPLLFSQLNMRR